MYVIGDALGDERRSHARERKSYDDSISGRSKAHREALVEELQCGVLWMNTINLLK